jgi:hypothetical protein
MACRHGGAFTISSMPAGLNEGGDRRRPPQGRPEQDRATSARDPFGHPRVDRGGADRSDATRSAFSMSSRAPAKSPRVAASTASRAHASRNEGRGQGSPDGSDASGPSSGGIAPRCRPCCRVEGHHGGAPGPPLPLQALEVTVELFLSEVHAARRRTAWRAPHAHPDRGIAPDLGKQALKHQRRSAPECGPSPSTRPRLVPSPWSPHEADLQRLLPPRRRRTLTRRGSCHGR